MILFVAWKIEQSLLDVRVSQQQKYLNWPPLCPESQILFKVLEFAFQFSQTMMQLTKKFCSLLILIFDFALGGCDTKGQQLVRLFFKAASP